MAVVPCRRILSALDSSPAAVKCIVSPASDGAPVAVRIEPPVACEFWHPCPGCPLLPHGQLPPVPSPKQNAVKIQVVPRSRANTSERALVSPPTSVDAWLSNTTTFPFPAIEHAPLPMSPWTPPVDKLAPTAAPAPRSRTNTSS